LCAPFAIVLSHLLSFFPLYWTSLPSVITLSHLPSLSLLNHHTFSFLGLGHFLFPCAKNHSHMPLFLQVFFLFPWFSCFYHCTFPFAIAFSLLNTSTTSLSIIF
jgi:hypothetical protein